MSMDLLPWVIRAILIVEGIILAIMIWKGKKEGRYQRYDFRFFVIGTTAFIMGGEVNPVKLDRIRPLIVHSFALS